MSSSPPPQQQQAPDDAPQGVAASVYWFGSKVLSVIDYVGESVADALGITTPRYQFVLDAYERHCDEVREEEEALERALQSLREKEDSEIVFGKDVEIAAVEGQLKEDDSGFKDVELAEYEEQEHVRKHSYAKEPTADELVSDSQVHVCV